MCWYRCCHQPQRKWVWHPETYFADILHVAVSVSYLVDQVRLTRSGRAREWILWYVECEALRVNRRRIASVEAGPCCIAVAYLIIWS